MFGVARNVQNAQADAHAIASLTSSLLELLV
jgi:hypothetical protein